MPLIPIRPELAEDRLFMVKEVLVALSVTNKTLLKYRKAGIIEPVNPDSNRPLFSGRSVMECWDKAIHL